MKAKENGDLQYTCLQISILWVCGCSTVCDNRTRQFVVIVVAHTDIRNGCFYNDENEECVTTNTQHWARQIFIGHTTIKRHLQYWQTAESIVSRMLTDRTGCYTPMLIQHRVHRTSYADTPHSISHFLCWYSTQHIVPPMLIQHTSYRASYADTAYSTSHL